MNKIYWYFLFLIFICSIISISVVFIAIAFDIKQLEPFIIPGIVVGILVPFGITVLSKRHPN